MEAFSCIKTMSVLQASRQQDDSSDAVEVIETGKEYCIDTSICSRLDLGL